MASPAARSCDGELDVGGRLLVVVFAVVTPQTINFLFEEELGLDGRARDAAVAAAVRLAARLIF